MVEFGSELKKVLKSKMEIQIQPDSASCFATAIAMVIDKPVAEVISKVNKPYMDIIHPGREGSLKFRGHHPQDFTKYLQDEGWCLTINYSRWPAQHFYEKGCLLCGGKGKFKGRWEDGDLLIFGNVGVLQYGNHFCAWDGSKVYNPTNGEVTDFYTFRLIGFHPLYRIARG